MVIQSEEAFSKASGISNNCYLTNDRLAHQELGQLNKVQHF